MASKGLSTAVGCLSFLLASCLSYATVDTGFISAVGTQFVDKNCSEFTYSGANVWQIVEAEAGLYGGSPTDVKNMFASAQNYGINVIRFFPFGVFSDFTLQTAPGIYNQKNWDALDSIIQQAGQANIKLIMPFADNWIPVNGKVQYVAWANETDPDTFFTSPKIKQLYKNHIKAMTSHINELTNLAYKDDPTIFAWDLINEVRSACNTSALNASCSPAAADYIQDWIVEMSQYYKSVSPNQMLTVGEEGFYPAGDPKAAKYNPGEEFSTTCGQDFVRNHRPASIDFAATHIWIDNWQTNQSFCGETNNPSCGISFIDAWLSAHEADATALNKPLVVEEFGNSPKGGPPNATIREGIFDSVYTAYNSSVVSGSPNLRGVAFWQWFYSPGLNLSLSDASYAVQTGDEVWDEVIAPSFEVTMQSNAAEKMVANCVPGHLKATSSSASPISQAGRRFG